MDDIDQAQEYDEMHRANALREHFRQRDTTFCDSRNPGLHPQGAGPGRKRICLDCGEEILDRRLQFVPNAVRCRECQELKEKGERR